MKSRDEVLRLVGELDSLKTGEKAAARLVQYGAIAIEPLRKFLLEGSACERRAAASPAAGKAPVQYCKSCPICTLKPSGKLV